MDTAPAAGQRRATAAMPAAWASLLEISSRTVIPWSWMEGKDSTGSARLRGDRMVSSTHCLMFIIKSLPYRPQPASRATAFSAAAAASGV